VQRMQKCTYEVLHRRARMVILVLANEGMAFLGIPATSIRKPHGMIRARADGPRETTRSGQTVEAVQRGWQRLSALT
jgi:hypothetical protein